MSVGLEAPAHPAVVDDLPPEAHAHIDALQQLLGVRIGRGSLTINFDQDRARSTEITLHRHVRGRAAGK